MDAPLLHAFHLVDLGFELGTTGNGLPCVQYGWRITRI